MSVDADIDTHYTNILVHFLSLKLSQILLKIKKALCYIIPQTSVNRYAWFKCIHSEIYLTNMLKIRTVSLL